MRFLRKILLALGILVVLSVLRILLQKHFPVSLSFHYNLISCLQLITLAWAVVTGILETTILKHLQPPKARRISFLTFTLFLVLMETITYRMLHHPSAIPRLLLPTARYYYNNYQRNILQFDPAISQYDSALFYRMKSDNRCVFSNIEFSDSIFTDSRGFRNDTHGLDHPTVICMGDSYTLGWGVRQKETYAFLLQQMLGCPVLNTGMSSYGSAREIASTKSLDRSALRTVVIQYCSNDAEENEAYVRNDHHPFISPPSVYDSAKNILKWSKTWFPFKYFCTSAKIILSEQLIPALRHSPEISGDTTRFEREASLFLEVLKGSNLNFDTVNVFVFNIEEYDQLSGRFISALEKRLADPSAGTRFNHHIHPLHVERLFSSGDYYILDGHLRPSGHIKLARALADSIQKTSALLPIGHEAETSAAIPASTARQQPWLQALHLRW